MKAHEIKCWTGWYEATINGKKLFECRINDRGYAEGDVLFMREFDPARKQYTGRSAKFLVTFVLTDHPGLKPGYCIMQIRRIADERDADSAG